MSDCISSNQELTSEVVTHLTCRWRYQKNGNNSQCVTFAGDPKHWKYCIVEAGLRIYHRSKQLGMNDHGPIAVYRTMEKTRFITSRKVTSLL